MYKNFSISEEERKQILESHRNHGYGKPLKEQEDQYSNDGLELNDNVYINVNEYDINLTTSDEDEILVHVNNSEEGSDFEVIENTSEIDDEKIIEFVKNKLFNEGLSDKIPTSVIYDLNTNEFKTY